MLRRILLLVTVAAVMLTISVAPAFAGISQCKNQKGYVASEYKAKCNRNIPQGPPITFASVVNLTSVTSSANAASVGVGAPLLVIGGLLAYRMVNSKR